MMRIFTFYNVTSIGHVSHICNIPHVCLLYNNPHVPKKDPPSHHVCVHEKDANVVMLGTAMPSPANVGLMIKVKEETDNLKTRNAYINFEEKRLGKWQPGGPKSKCKEH
jgi:hypothetical protein